MNTWFDFVTTWFRDTVMPLFQKVANLEIPVSETEYIHLYTLELLAFFVSLFCIIVYNDDSD